MNRQKNKSEINFICSQISQQYIEISNVYMFFLPLIQSESLQLGYSFKLVFIGLYRRKTNGTEVNVTGRPSTKYTKLITSSKIYWEMAKLFNFAKQLLSIHNIQHY